MTNLPVQRDLSPVQLLEGPSSRSSKPEPQRDFGLVLDRTLRDSPRDLRAASARDASEAHRGEEPQSSRGEAERSASPQVDAARDDRQVHSRCSEAKSEAASRAVGDEGGEPAKAGSAQRPEASSPRDAKVEGKDASAAQAPDEKPAKQLSGRSGPDGTPQVALSPKGAKIAGAKVESAKIAGAKVGADAAAILAKEKAALAAQAEAAKEVIAQPKLAIENAAKKSLSVSAEKKSEKGAESGAEAIAAALVSAQVTKNAPELSSEQGAGSAKKEAVEAPSKRGGAVAAGQSGAKQDAQPQLTVIDLRGVAHHETVQPPTDPSLQPNGSQPRHQSIEVRLIGFDPGGNAAADGFARSDSVLLPSRQDAVNTLQQNWGPLMNQVMKSAGILLRDNDSGEIRLVLKPEHLGSVRIQLEMKDSLISGKIVVENQNVRQLFQQNLESLYRAFQESGFTNAGLNVSVSGNGTGGREKGRHSGPPVAEAVSGLKSLAEHIPDLQLIGMGESLVNLYV